MKSIVSERLKEFIKFKRISVNKFEKLCGLSNSYVANIRNAPSYDVIDKIKAIYPDLNEEWLLTGEGNMISEDTILYNKVGSKPIEQQSYTTYLVPLCATGGTLADFDEPGAMLSQCEQISVPIAADLAIPVAGDSMEPEYPNGSIVLVKKVDPSLYIEWGEVYVIDSINGRVIKEVRQASASAINCISRNRPEQYAPFSIELSAVRAMYRVLMVMARK